MNTTRFMSRLALVCFLTLISAQISLHAQPGSLDPTFNATVTTGHWGFSVAVQPDGKVIAGGTFGILRFLDDGSVDPSFNPPIPAGQTVLSVSLQPDGRVLVAGSLTNAAGAALRGILRLEPDGSIDPAFNLAPDVFPQGRPLALQPDGRILAAGVYFAPGETEERVGLFRLNADGSLDPQFDFGWWDGSAGFTAIALKPEGDIYFAGAAEIGAAYPHGSYNESFRPESGIGPWGALAVQRDGKVMVGQYGDGSTFTPLRRLLANGSDDPDWLPTRMDGGDCLVQAILIQPDGKVLAGGNNLQSFNGVLNPSLGRLHPDGTVDLTFDAGADLHYYSVEHMASTPDGKLIVAGLHHSRPDVSPAPGIWRLNNDAGPRGIEFASPSYRVKENERVATITIRRSGPANERASVRYDLEPGSALHGRDYVGSGGTLTFLPGETSKSFDVRIKADQHPERFETVHLFLERATGGDLGPQRHAVLTILD